MSRFEKIKKKYSLNNSYFKNIRGMRDVPGSPEECFQYFEEHGELPFQDSHYFEDGEINDWWLYDCFVEYQKRAGVYQSQFFTPPDTAGKVADLADLFFDDDIYVLDACCGFGSLTKALREKHGFLVRGFDIDHSLVQLYNDWSDGGAIRSSFEEFSYEALSDTPFRAIVANPPYEIPVLTDFLNKMYRQLSEDGKMILILPSGFIDKDRPKQLVETLGKYGVLHREPMKEEFARTKIRAEIVVLEKVG